MASEILGVKPPQVLPVKRAGVGKPLVLVHGYLGGSDQWEAQIPILGQHFDVVTLDLAGYGLANTLTAPTSMGEHARNVLATLDHIGIERFHLLGHSMGGMVVQEVTKLAPHRIEKLVLYATGPLGCIPGRFETMERSRERLREDGLPRTAKRISATWLLDGDASPAFEALSALATQASEQAAIAGLNAMESWDGRAHLSGIEQPTLIIWGERDRTYGWSQIEMLWRTIPNASLAVLPNCAHAVHLERGRLFETLLLEFLV
ncbi:MAG: alpha/beta fold hydrolase [Betaproteobacteria bacterium]|nr:MAG: alpha/beta fold hydrolase [Betaproteobacteria bacterium]